MIVKLTGEFVQLAEGRTEIELMMAPTTIRSLFSALELEYPTGQWKYCCVAVNGTMYQDAWYTPIGPNDEVVLMPAIGGG